MAMVIVTMAWRGGLSLDGYAVGHARGAVLFSPFGGYSLPAVPTSAVPADTEIGQDKQAIRRGL
jgi:hypothetical protein